VLDRYDDAGLELLTRMTEHDRQRSLRCQCQAVRAQRGADLLFVNHVLLGAPVGAASGLPYMVKAAEPRADGSRLLTPFQLPVEPYPVPA